MLRPSHDAISRIVRFERDQDVQMAPIVASRGQRCSFDSNSDGILDYDSCVSPSLGISRSYTEPNERLSALVENINRGRSSSTIDSSGQDDYDSCLSPVHSPRWSLRDLDEFIKTNQSPSFNQLHSLLLDGKISHFSACPSSDDPGCFKLTICPKIQPKTVIVSGSFNPLHHGHEALARRAIEEQRDDSSGEYFFEMSTFNVDKGPLSADEMEKRVSYIISRGHCCLLTNAILFDAKSDLFPNCTFAIGFDTYIRVVNPKYYPKVTGGIEATMARIEANGCEFFVGGRVTQGIYRTLLPSPRRHSSSPTITPGIMTDESNEFDLVELPPASDYRGKTVCVKKVVDDGGSSSSVDFDACNEEPMSPIFSGITAFRHDISSTEIRNGSINPNIRE